MSPEVKPEALCRDHLLAQSLAAASRFILLLFVRTTRRLDAAGGTGGSAAQTSHRSDRRALNSPGFIYPAPRLPCVFGGKTTQKSAL